MFVVHVPLIVVTNDNVLNSSVFMATAWLFLMHCALHRTRVTGQTSIEDSSSGGVISVCGIRASSKRHLQGKRKYIETKIKSV